VKSFADAIGEAGSQVAGRKIEIITEDDLGKAEGALDKARKLVENDKVSMIIGPTGGDTVSAVSEYVNKVGIPQLTTTPSPTGIILGKNQWTILTAGTYNLNGPCMARYAFEQLGLKNVDIMTADWAGGHGHLDAFIKAWKKLGGQIAQEQYPPRGTGDYGPYFTGLKDAESLVAWFDGADGIRFLSQYTEFGMWQRMPLLAAFFGSFLAPITIKALPPAAAQAVIGKLTPSPYSPLLDFPVNKQFVDAFKKKYNFLPEDVDSGPYQGALITLAALKATGGDTTPEKLRDAILNVQVEGPEGPLRFDKDLKCIIKNTYISKIDKQGNDYLWVPVYTYKDVPPLGF
jgi:branched-chain amino acid transport system substrate-binding protein